MPSAQYFKNVHNYALNSPCKHISIQVYKDKRPDRLTNGNNTVTLISLFTVPRLSISTAARSHIIYSSTSIDY